MPEMSQGAAPLRDAVERAVRTAAASDPYPERRLEGALVRAVQSQLDADPAVDSTRREARAREDGWTRRPGGVDLVVDAGGCRAGLEFKLDHADQCLWDALKLCGEPFDLRALVVEAAEYVWRDPSRAGTEFLAPGDTLVTWKTTELIARWPVAWRDLMIGGRGIRPTRSVSTFATVGGMDEQLAAHPGHRIRVRWITPREAESVAFDAIGWPSGCGAPPDGFARAVRAADANRRSEGGAALPWPPDDDSTLTFADIPRRLPHGRAHEAVRQAWPRILEEDRMRVRAELIRRGWTPEEFELCGIGAAR